MLVNNPQPTQTPIFCRAQGLDPLAVITDDGRLMATLDQVMLGWQMVRDPDPATKPVIRIEHGPKGWTCSGEGFKKPVTYLDPVSTACSLIAELFKQHTLANHDRLVLHAAGVRAVVGGREGLVLLTGHYRAGKSVFTATCAAAGIQVFSDDIIPLDWEAGGGLRAIAPGLAIRLRLPLPDNMAPETRAFIQAHGIATKGRYAYIHPPRDRLAWRGDSLPICAVVSLRRTEGASLKLNRLAQGDALRETILRNFARETPAGTILDTLDTLVGGVPCYSLTYDQAEDAAALIGDGLEGRGCPGCRHGALRQTLNRRAPARSYSPGPNPRRQCP